VCVHRIPGSKGFKSRKKWVIQCRMYGLCVTVHRDNQTLGTTYGGGNDYASADQGDYRKNLLGFIAVLEKDGEETETFFGEI
jgi:hypothetical protein